MTKKLTDVDGDRLARATVMADAPTMKEAVIEKGGGRRRGGRGPPPEPNTDVPF